jgi:hypothetical protein
MWSNGNVVHVICEFQFFQWSGLPVRARMKPPYLPAVLASLQRHGNFAEGNDSRYYTPRLEVLEYLKNSVT